MAHDPDMWRTIRRGFRNGCAKYCDSFRFSIYLIEQDPHEAAQEFLEHAKSVGVDLGGWEPTGLRQNPPYAPNHPLVGLAKQMQDEWPWLGEFCWSDSEADPRLLDIVADARNKNSERAFREFRVRAAIAGAHLPVEFRDQMPVDRDDPVERWLSVMLYLDPTTRLNLRIATANWADLDELDRTPFHVVSLNPFQDAADAIERCRLDTDEPAFLPMLEPLIPESAPVRNERWSDDVLSTVQPAACPFGPLVGKVAELGFALHTTAEPTDATEAAYRQHFQKMKGQERSLFRIDGSGPYEVWFASEARLKSAERRLGLFRDDKKRNQTQPNANVHDQ